MDKWHGSVKFEDGNSVALASYANPDTGKIISRLVNILKLFRTALAVAQDGKLCCESFTILRYRAWFEDEDARDPWVVEVSRVDFNLAVQLLAEVQAITDDANLQPAGLRTATKLVDDLFPGLYNRTVSTNAKPLEILHICSLAVQILTTGFESYIQAHEGSLQPCFLDDPIKKVKLLGISATTEQYPFVVATLMELTCMGEMLLKPVLVFSACDSKDITCLLGADDSSSKLDLFTSPEDLIDTWGPGQFLLPPESRQPSAILINDGAVYQGNGEFHWGKGSSRDKLLTGKMELSTKIRIGAPVTRNDSCQLDEEQHHNDCADFLRELGTRSPGFDLEELQFGLQGCSNVLVQANATYKRSPGVTSKQRLLRNVSQELPSSLESYWGVQFSLCTGVARRVQLREMVADLLLVFASCLTAASDFANWERLKTDHDIIEAFRQHNIVEWLRKLDPPLHDLVLRLINNLLNTLGDTGLDDTGDSFLISWPWEKDINRGLEIDVKAPQCSWVRLIADDAVSATFAYATPKCLETAEIRCRSTTTRPWLNLVPLLETAVMVRSEPALGRPQLCRLRHEERYFFRKFSGEIFVRASKPQSATEVRLIEISRFSGIPPRILLRMFRRGEQVRERRITEDGGEVVTISADTSRD
ncbi:hypothetical protein B0T10DRAFT_565250 [Thelonectria olida]|uniref:Uncharacterized protein n=1 Tax=Thelonectria olida TaxID=1576542 RepID=A0A9P8VZQ2_9HYPO|nr:hypothetical protein B0T10DRAFT_565250 [Thelonectria olida]